MIIDYLNECDADAVCIFNITIVFLYVLFHFNQPIVGRLSNFTHIQRKKKSNYHKNIERKNF